MLSAKPFWPAVRVGVVRNLSKTQSENPPPEDEVRGVRGFESHLPHQKRPAPHSISLLPAFLSPALAHGDFAKSIRFFFKTLFLSGLDSGLVLEDGGIIGVSVIFRCVHIPVATSVKYRALEDRLPRIGIGVVLALSRLVPGRIADYSALFVGSCLGGGCPKNM